MFKNMKLSVKLIGAFGLVLILLGTVMGVYQYITSSTTANFENLMKEEVAIANHAAAVEAYMLQSRRNEKDFLLRKDKKYIQKLEKNVALLKAEAQAIVELAGQMGDQKSASKASAIIDYAEEYENAFKQLVTSWETRGLDEKSGLQGKFRNIVHGLAEDMKEHQIDNLQMALLMMRRYEKDYIRTKSDKYKQKFLATIETYKRLLEESTCEKNSKKIQEQGLSSYSEAFNNYLAAGQSADLKDQYYQAMRSAAHDIEKAIGQTLVPDCKALLLNIRKNEKDYLLRNDEKYVKKTHASIEKLLTAFKNAGVLQQHINDAATNLIAYKQAFDALVVENGKIASLAQTMRTAVHKIEPEVEDFQENSKKTATLKVESTATKAHSLAKVAIGTGTLSIVLGIFLAFFISGAISRPINRIVDGLNEGAEQVASASGQVSAASQSLAEGASEQAASIEETTSSLEEMSSMTRQNAANANEAKNITKEANQVVSKANTSMEELTESMTEIYKASEETSKIIKTIDEIAFQTNLLALNAAVEAARAGEAGAGFAVVADEVRNLAMRAANAAKDTAELIESTVGKTKAGTNLVERTNEAFSEVAASSAKIGELIGEIAAASNEQANGIEQVNLAVTEMDKITQQNAANAEESASASEEMNAQAEQMKGVVDELLAIVNGSSNGAGRVHFSAKRISSPETHQTSKTLTPSTISKVRVAPEAVEVSPDQVIPMDDGDFKDF